MHIFKHVCVFINVHVFSFGAPGSLTTERTLEWVHRRATELGKILERKCNEEQLRELGVFSLEKKRAKET